MRTFGRSALPTRSPQLGADQPHGPPRRRPPSGSGRCRWPRPAHRRRRGCGCSNRPGSSRELLADHVEGLAGLALLPGLADADDGDQAGAMGGHGLGADVRVRLAVVLPALGMADEHVGRAGIGQHLGRDVAGEGAGFLGVAILAADGDPGADGACRAKARSGSRAGRRPDRPWPCSAGRVARPGSPSRTFAEALQAVHLPVARHQRARPIDAHSGTPVTLDNWH